MTMFAVYQTADGKLVSIGSVVANPLPAGLAALALTPEDGLALTTGLGVWNPATLSVDLLPPDVTAPNERSLLDLATLLTKFTELKAFLSDVDVQVVLDQPNNQALTTQQLNRALKAGFRQQRRAANFDLRLARYVFGQVHRELLTDISDTTGN